MSRNIDAAYVTESLKDSVRVLSLVELNFSGGFVRVNSSDRTLTFQGNQFLGVGNLGSISNIQEGTELTARGINLQLSGIPSENISLAFNEYYQGRDAKIWMGFLNEDYQILSTPILMFLGFMDNMRITMGKTATISLSLESKFVDWSRPRVRRYTHEDQTREFADDVGLEYVTEMAEKEIVWGK